MDTNSSQQPPQTPENLDLLLPQALKALQDPHYNPEGPSYKKISRLFHNLDLFKKTFGSSSNLDDFILLAKWHLNYEVHPYGTVLLKEQDYADRICIILDGKMQKFQQKPFSQVEKDAVEYEKQQKERERRNSYQPVPMSPNILGAPDQRKQRRRLSAWAGQTPQTPQISAESKPETPRIELPKLEAPKLQPNFVRTRKISMTININPVITAVPSLNEVDNSGSENLQPIKLSIPVLQKPEGNNVLLTVNGLSPHISTQVSPQVSPQASPNKEQQVNQIRKRLSVFNYQSNMMSSPRDLAYPSYMDLQEEKEQPEETSQSLENNKNCVNLLQAMSTKQPEIKSRCFYKEVPRVLIAKDLKQGEWFGENIFRHHHTKENSIMAVASDEVHLLTLTRESWRKILTELSSQVNKKAHFFKNIFPTIDEKQVVKFSKHFDERILQKDEVLYQENDLAEALYFVQSGEIMLVKDKQQTNFQASSSHMNFLISPRVIKKKELPVAMIREKQVFGEELILNKEVRQYKAITHASNTEVYVLEGQDYRKIKEKYEDFFEILVKQAQEKSDWRQERVHDLLDQFTLEKRLSTEGPANSQLKMTSSHFLFRPQEESPLLLKNESAVVQSQARLNTKQAVIRRTSLLSTRSNTREFIEDPTNDLYRQKFGRTVRTPAYLEEENPLGSARKGTRPSKFFGTSEPIEEDPLGFNVRKELDEKRPKALPMLSPRITTSPVQQNKQKTVVIKSTKTSKKKFNPMIITTSLEPKPLISVQNVASEVVQQTQEDDSPISPGGNGTISDLEEQVESNVFSDKATMNKLMKAVNYKPKKKKMSLLVIQGKKSKSGTAEVQIGKARSHTGIS